MDDVQPQEKEASTIDTSMTEEEQPKLEAGLKIAEEQTEVEDNEVAPIEPEVEIPDDVEELLEEISSSNPAGIEIESSDDDDAISFQMDLEGEMEKRSGNKYDNCVKWGKSLLVKHSKDLSIAVWLTISWFRVTGLSGLNKGLILLAELLNKYGEKCYPQGKEKQARVFRSLNNDPRLLILRKISFEEEIPVFKVTTEILESPVAKEELPREILFKMTRFKEQSFVGEEQFLGDIKNELFPRDDKKAKLVDKYEEKLLKIFREAKTAEKPTEFSVTDRFVKIIKSVADFKKHDGVFLDIKDEQFTSSERFIDELVQRFSDNNILRQTINPYLPLFNCLGNNTIAHLMELKQGYEYFLETLAAYFGEEVPELSNLSDLIGKQTQETDKLVSAAVKEAQAIYDAQKVAEQQRVSQLDTTPELPTTPDDTGDIEIKPPPRIAEAIRPVTGSQGEVTAQNLQITRETESIIAVKKALLFYFREEKTITESDGKTRKEKVSKVTSDPRIYGISRSLRWNNIKIQVNDNAVTGPDEVKQKYLQGKLNDGDVDTVIADFESNFIENEQLQFWLDGQRFVVQSLEQKGTEWNLCANEIKFHLAKLLLRMPGLPKLTFRDKKTLFANPETQSWIENEVLGIMGSGKPQEKILPPIMGEDYEPINKEYEAACDQLPENFEENAKLIQQAIAGDLRIKGKFLRKLNLANYCCLAKKYELARALFDELVNHIEQYHIVEWEQALCVSVWQSMYLNNLKLLAMDNFSDQKSKIENENKDIITKISKYDVVLALNLTKHEGG